MCFAVGLKIHCNHGNVPRVSTDFSQKSTHVMIMFTHTQTHKIIMGQQAVRSQQLLVAVNWLLNWLLNRCCWCRRVSPRHTRGCRRPHDSIVSAA